MTRSAARRKLWFALFLLVVVVAPYYWLLCDNHARAASIPGLTLGELHEAANALPGAKPQSLRVIAVASRLEAGTLLVAGGGVRRIETGDFAIVLQSPSGNTVIDSGPSAANVRAAGLRRFSEPAEREIQAELSRAAHIVFTSDSPEAVGGFLASADPQLLATKLVADPQRSEADPAGSKRALPVARAARADAPARDFFRPIAPGVVQIDAPAYGGGGKMYFVSFANGFQLLVAGEAVPTVRNLTAMRLRSRLWTDILHPANRGVAWAWLETVARWKQHDPQIIVMPGHDIEWLRSNAAALEKVVTRPKPIRPK